MTKKQKYMITSKPGMTPFAYTSDKAEAKKLSEKAKRIGLIGEVRKLEHKSASSLQDDLATALEG